MSIIYPIILLALWALYIWGCITIAKKKGMNVSLAGILGLFFGLFAVIGYALARNRKPKRIVKKI